MELPKVYANPIDKELNNKQDVFKSESDTRGEDVRSYLDKLYSSGRITYMIKFLFNVDGKEFYDQIAIRNGSSLVLKSGKKINVGDIRYIKEIKK